MQFSICRPYSHFLLSQHRLVCLPHSQFHSVSHQTEIPKHITCATNKRRRHWSAKSRKIVQSAIYIASKLKIVPEPLDFLIQELGFGGGNRGGFSGFRKGFGWGGFDGWGMRRNKKKLQFLIILVVLCLGLWFISGNRLNSDVFLGTFGMLLLGLSADGWRRGLKHWILGFCCCGFLVSRVLKKKDVEKLLDPVLQMRDSQKWAKSFVAMAHGRRRRR